MKIVSLLGGTLVLTSVILMGLVTKISIGVMEAREITDEFMRYETLCYMLGGLVFCEGMLCFLLIKMEENLELGSDKDEESIET